MGCSPTQPTLLVQMGALVVGYRMCCFVVLSLGVAAVLSQDKKKEVKDGMVKWGECYFVVLLHGWSLPSSGIDGMNMDGGMVGMGLVGGVGGSSFCFLLFVVCWCVCVCVCACLCWWSGGLCLASWSDLKWNGNI